MRRATRCGILCNVSYGAGTISRTQALKSAAEKLQEQAELVGSDEAVATVITVAEVACPPTPRDSPANTTSTPNQLEVITRILIYTDFVYGARCRGNRACVEARQLLV